MKKVYIERERRLAPIKTLAEILQTLQNFSMDFEQLLNRYFEIEEVLKNKSSSLNEIEISKLKAEHENMYSNFFQTFMVVRIKLGLDPELKCQDWIKKEYDQMVEQKRFLDEIDNVLGE